MPNVVGRRLFWAFSDRAIATAADLDAPATVLYERPRESWILAQAITDGTDLIWIEFVRGGTPAELWTSPYAEISEDLRPRLVTELPRYIRTTLGEGLAAFRFSAPERLVLVDVRSGDRYRFDPPGWSFSNDQVYVSRSYVLTNGSRDPEGDREEMAVLRIPFSSFRRLADGEPL